MEEPDDTHTCTTQELLDTVTARPDLTRRMLIRASDEPTAPWKRISTIEDEWIWDKTGPEPIQLNVATVHFDDGTTRFIGAHTNEITVGFNHPS